MPGRVADRKPRRARSGVAALQRERCSARALLERSVRAVIAHEARLRSTVLVVERLPRKRRQRCALGEHVVALRDEHSKLPTPIPDVANPRHIAALEFEQPREGVADHR